MLKKNVVKSALIATTISVAGLVAFIGCQGDKLSQNNPVTSLPEVTATVAGIDDVTLTEFKTQINNLQSSDASVNLKVQLVSDLLTITGDAVSLKKLLSIPQPLAKTNNTYCLTCGPCIPPVQHQGRYYNKFFATLDLIKIFGGGTVSSGACNCGGTVRCI